MLHVVIMEACGPCPYIVRADGLQVMNGLEHDLAKVQEWITIVDSVLRKNYE